jgi:hypothetical protein
MDQTPAALFDAFEQDFRYIINSISEKLEGSGKNQLGGAFNRPLYRWFDADVVQQNSAKLPYAKLKSNLTKQMIL